MKKRLLSFSMLVLSIGILSTETFAQEDAGGASFQGVTFDSPINTVTTVPPPGVTHVKRNNGNGTTALGNAEARLSFSKNANVEGIQLQSVSYLGGAEIVGAVTAITQNNAEIDYQKKYVSYPLGKNVSPAKKLMFHFSSPSGNFSIPETN